VTATGGLDSGMSGILKYCLQQQQRRLEPCSRKRPTMCMNPNEDSLFDIVGPGMLSDRYFESVTVLT
jgi:hypothetical protein